jgi:hypothetical protein
MRYPKWFNVIVLVVMLLAALPAQAAPPDHLTRARRNDQVLVEEADKSALFASVPLPPRDADAVQIRLQQAVFDPLQTMPQLEQTLTQIAYSGDGTGYYLVQFHGPILPEWKTALIDAGATLHEYVPDFAFIVKMNAAVVQRVQALEMVRWVGLYQPAFRLSNALLSTVQNADPEKTLQIVVRSFTGEPAATLATSLTGLGATILTQGVDTGGGTIFQLELPATAVANVARLPGVAWVEPRSTPRLANAISRSSVAMNKDAVENTLGLYGENQIVVVGDTGFSTGNTATMHPDFRGHFYQGSWGGGTCGTWADANGHGTHVAGSVLGNGVMDGAVTTTHSYAGTNAGIAPEALLWGWAFCSDWSGLPDTDPYADYYGVMYADDSRVRVNTNSWSYNTTAGTYNTFSRETDRFIWDHPDMVVLFAASNDGTDANSDGIVDLDSMGVPGGSKNIITVGASENYRMSGGYNPGGPCNSWGGCWPSDYPAAPINGDLLSDDPSGMVAFSSRGPVDDGRLKPDVVAPGSNIVSTRDDSTTGWGIYNDYYIYMGGTSMATPLTAGAAAVVREFYTDTYGIDPTAALVKATFINGAHDMTPGQYRDEVPSGSQDDVTRRPDINQGWGRVDLATSLIYEAPRQLWFYEHAGLATNGEYSVTFHTGYAENPFRVSLVWSDQAGTEASYGALVNDLDLVVESSTGSTYYGNDIVDDGLLDGDVDHTNNVEGIDLAPGIATYTVTVKGYNVPNGPQPFALVVSGDLGSAAVLDGVVSDAGTSAGISNAQIEATLVPTGTRYFTATAGDGTYSLALAAGTYDVTASAYGYAPQAVTGVSLTDGVTTTQNFALSLSPHYILTGTVTDASTGWALYASVEIEPDGYPATTVWTNPWTGVYSATIAGNYTHTLTVAPWSGIPGYVSQSRQVSLSADRYNENFALDVEEDTCNAPGYALIGLKENFDGVTPTALPDGWAEVIVNDTGSDPLWDTRAGTRYPSGYTAHSAPNLVYFNSWTSSSGGQARLYRTVGLDMTALSSHNLTFWMFHDDGYSTRDDRVQVQVSTDGGGSWVDVGAAFSRYSASGDAWAQHTVDLSAYSTEIDLRLGFLGISVYGNDIHLDDIQLGEGICAVPTGGLIAGSVYNRYTHAALTGATVSNQDGYTHTAQTTPDDALLDESFYVLYSPAGSKTFTATISGYPPSVVDDVPVVAGETEKQDFFFGNAFISQQTGNWSGSAWVSGTPTATDWVTITTGHTVMVDSAVAACYGLTIMPGAILVVPNGHQLTVESEVRNSGMLRQTKDIPGTGDVDFHLRAGDSALVYYGLHVAAGATLGTTTVDIYGSVISGTGNLSQTVGTWFDITPATPTAATLTVWYPASALNDNDPATTQLYHHAGGDTWELLTTLDRGTTGGWYWLQAAATGFSPFVIRSPDAPTAVGEHGLTVTGGAIFVFVMGLVALAVFFTTSRRLFAKR